MFNVFDKLRLISTRLDRHGRSTQETNKTKYHLDDLECLTIFTLTCFEALSLNSTNTIF